MLQSKSKSKSKSQSQSAAALAAAALAPHTRAFRSTSSAEQASAGLAVSAETDTQSELARMNEELASIDSDPLQVLRWTMQEFDGRIAMSTSFGIQSAVLLHLATTIKPDVPVVWVDTGYLPTETYQYAEALTEALGLNLQIASNSTWTPARMEAIHGKLWEREDEEAHSLYGSMRKVEPMAGALDALEPNPLVLLSGLRAAQTRARANMKQMGFQQGRFKVLPLLRMTDDDVAAYMDRFDLPAHPLSAKGYVSVGDWHSSRPVAEGEDPRDSRFGGKFQECGLHVDSHDEPAAAAAAEAPSSSSTSPTSPPPTVASASAVEALAAEPIAPIKLEPASLDVTGVEALGLTRVHPETNLAVIMVKKLTEDGTFCRKCIDVAGKIEADGLTERIGHTLVANVLDQESEGVVLAKHFGVATAPFFLVRDLATEQAKGEWSVMNSYLQLRKRLEKAADVVLASKETAADPVREDEARHDEAYLGALDSLRLLQLQVEKTQLQMREQQVAMGAAHKALLRRAEELGLQEAQAQAQQQD